MPTLQIVLSIIPIVISLAAIAIPLWVYYRQRYNLCWAHLRPKSMLDIAEGVAKSLKIFYNEQQIKNLTQYLFILHNTGFVPLKRDAIVSPLMWQAPGKILSARVVGTDPPVALILEHSEQQLSISWELFNQRCKALIEILCEGDANTEVGQVEGQIQNVPIIKQKEIRWVSEEEEIQRIQANFELQSGFSRSVGRVFASRWFIKTSRYIMWIYLGGICVVPFVFVIAVSELPWPWILTTGFAVAAFIFVLFFTYRNPYKKLLRSIENQSDPA